MIKKFKCDVCGKNCGTIELRTNLAREISTHYVCLEHRTMYYDEKNKRMVFL